MASVLRSDQGVRPLFHRTCFIARFAQIDRARAMAFNAIDEASGGTFGVVRIHADYELLPPGTFRGSPGSPVVAEPFPMP